MDRLGPGSGYSIVAMLKKEPAKIYGIEISPYFRDVLASKFSSQIRSGAVEIRADDAIKMTFLRDKSVDCVCGLNVIYFLDPLDAYLKEIKRVLKPGGVVVWGGKTSKKDTAAKKEEAAKRASTSPFKNLDFDVCKKAMEKAGFKKVTITELRLEGFAGYNALIGTR